MVGKIEVLSMWIIVMGLLLTPFFIIRESEVELVLFTARLLGLVLFSILAVLVVVVVALAVRVVIVEAIVVILVIIVILVVIILIVVVPVAERICREALIVSVPVII